MENNKSGPFDRVILVDKPAGISSFGVVARVRRKLTNEAGHKIKVGHTGTLDPFATGLLILVSGKFTRRAGKFSGLDKVYDATFRLGATSSTGDLEGEIIAVSSKRPSRDEVVATLAQFTGEIVQTPPAYSAVKINGQRAYKLARKGVEVKVPPRHVTVYSLELLDYSYPDVRVRAHVSSGTYIRSLAADVGVALGVGAYTVELRRVRVGKYDVQDAERLAEPK